MLGGALGHALAQCGEAAVERGDFGLCGGGASLGCLGILARRAQTLGGGLVEPRQAIGLTARFAQLALEAQLVVAGGGNGGTRDALCLIDGLAVARGVGECCSGRRARGLIVAHLLLDTGEVALAGERAPSGVAGAERDAAIGIEATTVGEHADAALDVEQVFRTVDQQDAVEQAAGNISGGLHARLEWDARPFGLAAG